MKFILRLMYGADGMVDQMLTMLAHRRKALAAHSEHVELWAKSLLAKADRDAAKRDYDTAREAVEAAYKLEF